MTDERAARGWLELLQPAWIPALVVMLGGLLLHSMNVLMIATIVPSIVDELGGAAMISWATSGFLASSIVAATCTGALSARIGARGAFAVGALVFCAGTLVCALSPSMEAVVAGRFVQGLGGGTLSATSYVLVRQTFPKELWPRAFALLAAVWGISVLVGPLVGGAFANAGAWRGAFWAVSGVAAVLAVAVLRALPKRASNGGTALPLGRVGFVCVGIALMSAAAVVREPAGKIALVVATFAVLFAVLRLDRSARRPLLPSDAFSFGTVTGTALWLGLLLSASFTSLPIYLPIILQRLHGLDPLSAGYAVATASLAWTLVAIAVSGAGERWSRRVLVLGPVVMIGGNAAVALLAPVGPPAAVIAGIALVGCGIGSCWAFTAGNVMGGARVGEEDIAASSVAVVQQMGLAFGAALAGIVANLAGLSHGVGAEEMARAASWVPAAAIATAVIGTVAGLRLRGLVGQRQPAAQGAEA